MSFSVKRLALISSVFAAMAAMPAAVGIRSAPLVDHTADACQTSEVTQIYFDGCLPSIDPPQAQVNQRGPDELPEIRGVPCDGTNSGTCIGLSRLPGGMPVQPDAVAPQPDTQVRSSP